MREIKFRIWSPNEELFRPIDGKMVGKIGNFISTSRIELDKHGTLFDLYGEPVVFQQFTGLKDKNGIEVYEGDIVKHHSGRFGVVEWISESDDYDYSGWNMKNSTWGDGIKGTEIIGNIFENPELIK